MCGIIHSTSVCIVFYSLFSTTYLNLGQIQSTGLPLEHPLHPTHPFFYSAPDSNEGVIRPGSFYAHAREGTLLRTIAPAKLVEFTQDSGDGSGVRLDNGRILKPSAVVLCTGYNNAYTRLFDGGLPKFSLVVDQC